MRCWNLNFVASALAASALSAGCDDGNSPAVAPDANTATSDAVAPGDAADPDADPGAPDAGPVETVWGERGPFNVGHLETSVTYAPPDGTPERTLRLVVWYPTEAETGAEVFYAGILPAEGVLGGAPPAAQEAPFPVVVFSHGNTAFAEQSHFLTTFLASHGFVVAAPDHTGNTFAASGDPPAEIFQWRPLDVGAVLDHLLAAEAPEALAGRLSDAIAVTGHSFGGYSSLAATGGIIDTDLVNGLCENGTLREESCSALRAHEDLYRAGFADPRIDASVPMTPGAVRVFGGTGLTGITVPTMLMTGDLDRTTPDDKDGDPAWTGLERRPDNVRVRFATAGHFTFSNGCDLAADQLAEDGCGARFIPIAQAHRAINAYTLAFLRRHLLGDERDAALLSGETTLEPDITLVHGGPEAR